MARRLTLAEAQHRLREATKSDVVLLKYTGATGDGEVRLRGEVFKYANYQSISRYRDEVSLYNALKASHERSLAASGVQDPISSQPQTHFTLSQSDTHTLEHLINRLLLIQEKEQELDAILQELAVLIEDPNLQPEDLRRKITELRARSPWFNHTVNPKGILVNW